MILKGNNTYIDVKITHDSWLISILLLLISCFFFCCIVHANHIQVKVSMVHFCTLLCNQVYSTSLEEYWVVNNNNNNNNNNNLYLHYSVRGKRKEEKKQNIENKIMEDLQLYIYIQVCELVSTQYTINIIYQNMVWLREKSEVARC